MSEKPKEIENREKLIEDLPTGKVMLGRGDEFDENIWVARDEENDLVYLRNHSVHGLPWGTPLKENPSEAKIDISPEAQEEIAERIMEWVEVCNDWHSAKEA